MPKNSSLGIIYSPNFLNTGWAPGPTVIVKGCYNPYKWPKINGCAWCYFTWNMSFHHTYNWFLGPPCVQTGHRLPTPSDTKAVPMASSMSTASLEREMWWPEDVTRRHPKKLRLLKFPLFQKKSSLLKWILNLTKTTKIPVLHYFQRGSHASAVNAKKLLYGQGIVHHSKWEKPKFITPLLVINGVISPINGRKWSG